MGFINSLKFTMTGWILLADIRAFPIWQTAILTANRLLSRAAEETDFLNRLPFTVHRRMDIQPQCRRDICMAEHFAHTLNVNSIFNAPSRIRVTKRVIAALSDTAPAQD